MDLKYIIIFVVILFILLSSKKENMCGCQRGNLDYYGHRKCMDWEETRRRRNF
jgi:hypothetical protein